MYHQVPIMYSSWSKLLPTKVQTNHQFRSYSVVFSTAYLILSFYTSLLHLWNDIYYFNKYSHTNSESVAQVCATFARIEHFLRELFFSGAHCSCPFRAETKYLCHCFIALSISCRHILSHSSKMHCVLVFTKRHATEQIIFN